MLDSVILIHALGVATGHIHKDAAHWDQALDSHNLVEHGDGGLAVSAISWFEVMRGLREPQTEALRRWHSRIEVMPVDARIAQRAGEIFAAARSSGSVCEHCLGFKPVSTCPTCGGRRSAQRRSHDIVIAATADTQTAIDVLYTHDGGMQALSTWMQRVSIRPPPRAAVQLHLEQVDRVPRPMSRTRTRKPK